MDQQQINHQTAFLTSSRPHILMITNHGIHQWRIIPGLPDTGGQNVFVNQFTERLAKERYKITIVNRGGFSHPRTGDARLGLDYQDENQRILYLEDDIKAFVRKEDMDERLPRLAEALQEQFNAERLGVDLIISHYWDGAKLGLLYNRSLEKPITHIWVPHSLGAIKKENVQSEQWDELRIDERIENEVKIVQEVDGIAATSAIIEQSLLKDYKYEEKPLFLPPCVDPERYHPRNIDKNHSIWRFLSEHCGLTPEEIYDCQIITEISRTDRTKRKDVLIKSFARIKQHHPQAMLVVSIDRTDEGLAKTLLDLIDELKIGESVAVLGSVWNQLPDIYAVTDIYCTPSIMEGFGMTSQEAAATSVPVVSSHLVPFVTEYLLADPVEEILYAGSQVPLKVGQAAVVVPADDISGFTHALDLLLSKPDLGRRLGEKAYQITIPYFTWENVVKKFLEIIGKSKSVKGVD